MVAAHAHVISEILEVPLLVASGGQISITNSLNLNFKDVQSFFKFYIRF